ncbi:MAG: DsbC family protein [Burkholderiales bacterium]|nr:MAG: DsbC family protein [Burkholderiales bacterium]
MKHTANKPLRTATIAAFMLLNVGLAAAQEAAIRKTLAARVPNLPPITSVAPAPIPGLYEVIIGPQIIYTDAKGEHLIEGNLVATQGMRNLTQERLDVVNAIPWKDLPLSTALVAKTGSGARKVVVFADPNCGYCKKLQSEALAKLKDATVYTIVIPILGPGSTSTSKRILCSKDPAEAWSAWMLRGAAPTAAEGDCDPAKPIDEALTFARARHVVATPTLVFPNGKRVASALSAEQLEALLASSQ